jgi:hypothetical protein
MKDFSIGFCHFETEENGNTAIKIGLSGFGKPARMKKNSKKLIKKLGVNLKDIIKGEYTDEVIANIDASNQDLTKEELKTADGLQAKAEEMKAADDSANDAMELKTVAKAFEKANKALNLNVVSLLKAAQSKPVTYTEEHIKIAEEAFRTAASLVDKYDEVISETEEISKKVLKVGKLRDSIIQNDLVNKYEKIWKKVQQAYDRQADSFFVQDELQAIDSSEIAELIAEYLPAKILDVDFEALLVSTDPPGDGWSFLANIIKQKITEVTNALIESGVKIAKEIPSLIIRKELSDIQVDKLTGMPVINTTKDAIIHYYTGKGRTVQLGDRTIDLIKNSADMRRYRKRITEGLTTSPANSIGNLPVNMTNEDWVITFHLGRMTMTYKTVCNGDSCTTTYTIDDDGFVDPNIIGSKIGGDDSAGPNNELMGTPYDYEIIEWRETYPNPGYKIEADGVPLPIEK